MWQWIKDRWEVIKDSLTFRQVALGGVITGTAALYSKWVSAPSSWLPVLPWWVVSAFALILYVFYFLLEFALKKKEELRPKLALSEPEQFDERGRKYGSIDLRNVSGNNSLTNTRLQIAAQRSSSEPLRFIRSLATSADHTEPFTLNSGESVSFWVLDVNEYHKVVLGAYQSQDLAARWEAEGDEVPQGKHRVVLRATANGTSPVEQSYLLIVPAGLPKASVVFRPWLPTDRLEEPIETEKEPSSYVGRFLKWMQTPGPAI